MASLSRTLSTWSHQERRRTDKLHIPDSGDEPACTYRFDALVLGFSLGVSTFKLNDSLYLWQEGYDHQEFVDISLLTVSLYSTDSG